MTEIVLVVLYLMIGFGCATEVYEEEQGSWGFFLFVMACWPMAVGAAIARLDDAE